MKKILGCFLCMMLLVFSAALSVHATPIDIKALNYIGSYNGIYLGGTLDLPGGTKQPQQDSLDNINAILNMYDDYDPLESLADSVESGDPIDLRAGIIYLNGNQFVTLKWDKLFGVWDVRGLSQFNFSGLSRDLSNYNVIPEASAALLLGSSLLGFGLLTWKRKKS